MYLELIQFIWLKPFGRISDSDSDRWTLVQLYVYVCVCVLVHSFSLSPFDAGVRMGSEVTVHFSSQAIGCCKGKCVSKCPFRTLHRAREEKVEGQEVLVIHHTSTQLVTELKEAEKSWSAFS